MLDDRKERAGVKFADAELIGIPIRVNVGRDAAESLVELKKRAGGEALKLHADEVLKTVKEMIAITS